MHNTESMAVAKKSSKKALKKPLIGFIGQGWIGKHYADDFEKRGYEVIRYALEEPYRANRARVGDRKSVV